ncbi:unnamed protein product, partial [Laminaria digitata]
VHAHSVFRGRHPFILVYWCSPVPVYWLYRLYQYYCFTAVCTWYSCGGHVHNVHADCCCCECVSAAARCCLTQKIACYRCCHTTPVGTTADMYHTTATTAKQY